MRKILVLAATAVVLTSCGRAAAEAPDSNNPAHCLAAFHYAAYWFAVGKEPDKVAQELAKGLYVMQRVKADGGSPPAVLAEAKQFTSTHVKNSKDMDALFIACSKAQAYDPRFRAEFGALIEKARPLVSNYEAAVSR